MHDYLLYRAAGAAVAVVVGILIRAAWRRLSRRRRD